jgi:hypothetical protein
MGRFNDLPKDIVWMIFDHVLLFDDAIRHLLTLDSPNHFKGHTGKLFYSLLSRTCLRSIKMHCVKHRGGWKLQI